MCASWSTNSFACVVQQSYEGWLGLAFQVQNKKYVLRDFQAKVRVCQW